MKKIFIFFFFVNVNPISNRHFLRKHKTGKIIIFVPEHKDYDIPDALLSMKRLTTRIGFSQSIDTFNQKISYLALKDITYVDKKDFSKESYKGFIECKDAWEPFNSHVENFFYIFTWEDYPMINGKKNIRSLFSDAVFYLREKYPDREILLIAVRNGGNLITDSITQLLEKKIFHIPYLILLGTSLGEVIEKKIMRKQFRGDYFFSRVYNVYSRGDVDQIKNIYVSFPFCNRQFKNKRFNLFNIDFGYIFEFSKNDATTCSYVYFPSKDDFMASGEKNIQEQSCKHNSVISLVSKIINNNFNFNSIYRVIKKYNHNGIK